MASLFGIVSDVLGALPFLGQLITGIEGLFGSGRGSSKLAAAVSAGTSAIQIYMESAGKTAPASLQADLKAAINANVKVMNDLGLLLPHTTAPASPGAPQV